MGFVVSMSTGWSVSLLQEFRARVIKSTVPLSKAHTKPEAVLSGHVTLLVGLQAQELEMEGAAWSPVLVTEKKIGDPTSVPLSPWLLAYLRNDGFLLPKKLWENIAKPIQIYGEIIPAQVGTQFGHSQCFIKVRCAAHIEFAVT